MNRKIGVWIDHMKAVIVALTPDGEMIQVVHSPYERHGHPSGGSRSSSPYGMQGVLADDSLERQSAVHLKKYYDDVIAHLGTPETVMIFGPGEAKVEFRKRLERKMMGRLVTAVEPADKMTETQILAQVRAYYAKA